MENTSWHKRAARVALIPAVFSLGCAATLFTRNNAVSQTAAPPVNPTPQVLNVQTAFEQVAEKLRPAVVFIKSQQTISNGGNTFQFRQGRDDGQGLPFSIPGFPGFGQGNGQFRVMPQGPQKATASGSGVIVRSDGYILTNDHVVANADKVTVVLQDGREFTGKVKRDFRSDLALIKIDANNLPAAELGNSDAVKVGQYAIAFGSPFGLSDTMTVGIVSSLHRSEAIGESAQDQRYYSSLIQTDASINPGNSGGALVDIYGRVIGINVAIESPTGGNVGIGFAIPANTARYIMDQLINKGTVTRGYLGLMPATPTYAQRQKYGVKGGAFVKMVTDGTPAAQAGFQVEDVVTAYNGKPVDTDATFRDLVARTAPGTRVDVTVKRDGREVTLHPTLGSAPQEAGSNNAPAEQAPAAATRGKLGVQVGDASDSQVRESLNIKGATQGAAVVEVVPGSPAQEAGIQQGDVIIRLNGQPIQNAEQLSAAARALKSGSQVTAVVRRRSETMLVQINLD
jgi:serine protease Do